MMLVKMKRMTMLELLVSCSDIIPGHQSDGDVANDDSDDNDINLTNFFLVGLS